MPSDVEKRLASMGLVLPGPTVAPPGAILPFAFAHARGNRLIISGHGPVDATGRICGPFGKVGTDVTPDEAYVSARATGLAILASIKEAIGSLDRIAGWVRLFGMVNSAPGFDQMPAVINGCSDLINAVFGPEVGRHARSAIGVAGLPWNMPVEIEGELLLRD